MSGPKKAARRDTAVLVITTGYGPVCRSTSPLSVTPRAIQEGTTRRGPAAAHAVPPPTIFRWP